MNKLHRYIFSIGQMNCQKFKWTGNYQVNLWKVIIWFAIICVYSQKKDTHTEQFRNLEYQKLPTFIYKKLKNKEDLLFGR